jgi:HPt (histidine-containing phosphotransfer) domain-containing protein
LDHSILSRANTPREFFSILMETRSMKMELLDTREIESLKSLENGPEDDFFDGLVDLFIQKTPEVVEVLKSGFCNGECSVVERAAHYLKGMGKNLGAVAFVHVCAKIEYEASRKGLSGLEMDIQRLLETHQATCNALTEQKRNFH